MDVLWRSRAAILLFHILLGLIISLGFAGKSNAQKAFEAPLDSDALDGSYVAVGPIASAVSAGETWDGGFGGELMLVRVTENAGLAAIGIGLGAIRFAHGNRRLGGGTGRLWADLLVATKRPFGIAAGLSGGITTEIDSVTAPRWGVQATLWTFVGVIPFVRVGTVKKNGTFIDFGIKVILPAARM